MYYSRPETVVDSHYEATVPTWPSRPPLAGVSHVTQESQQTATRDR
jgi:hypothetical protein